MARLYDRFEELNTLGILGDLKALFSSVGANKEEANPKSGFGDSGWYDVDVVGLENTLVFNYEDESENEKRLILRYFRDDHGEFIQHVEFIDGKAKLGEVAPLLALLSFKKSSSGGSVDIDDLTPLLGGSEYISVDLDADDDKLIIELDETNLEKDEATEDDDKLITSGAVYESIHGGEITADEIIATNTQSVQANLERIDLELEGAIDDIGDLNSGKLDASKSAVSTVGGLVTPTTAPTAVEIVGIDTNGAQVRIVIDTTDFTVDGTTSPYTLKLSS